MTKSKGVKITVFGQGLSYKGQVDLAVAGQIIAWCLSEDRNIPQEHNGAVSDGSNSHTLVPTPRPGRFKESASEYYNRHAPKRNPDRVLTLASYLKDARAQDSFTAKEIRSLFRDVGEILPGNFKRDFKWAVQNGWLEKDPGTKDGYYVTGTGTQALEAGFSKEVLDKTKVRSRGRTRSKKAKKN